MTPPTVSSVEPSATLLDCFIAGLEAAPDNLCLHVEGRGFTYQETSVRVATFVDSLSGTKDNEAVAGVYAGREAELYMGLLACLAWGKGYVPLSPEFPEDRIRHIIDGSGVRTIFTSSAREADLKALLSDELHAFNIVVLDKDAAQPDNSKTLTRPAQASDIAYLMFTSGSTGAPKGVPITHDNVLQFVGVMQDRYGIRPEDRVICLPDFYFDLSIFPIWVSWNAGSTIYVPSDKEKMMPAAYTQANGITVWCSVPSAVSFMSHFRVLKPNMFPDIKLSIFCGEPLLKDDARNWIDACPGSIIENLYGPTEVTVFSTTFPVTSATVDHGDSDVVSIGVPLEGVRTCIVGDDLRPVDNGQPGELCLAGRQVAPGYWRNPGLTDEKFGPLASFPDDDANRWYRTGDLVAMAPDGNMVFKGRIDDQVQVSGYRVELGDIEHAVRRLDGVSAAAAVFTREAGAKIDAIYVFAVGQNVGKAEILDQIRRTLPSYMSPRRIVMIDKMPLNKNGKIDKITLKARVAEGILT